MARLTLLAFGIATALSGSATTDPRSNHRSATADTVLPGSSSLVIRQLHPYSMDRQLTLTRADTTRPFGTQSEQLTSGSLEGRPALLHLITFDTPNALTVDSTWIDPTTLTPLRMVSSNVRRTLRLEFTSAGVQQTLVPAQGDSTVTRFDLKSRAFEWNMLPVAIAALPLRDGYETTLPVFSDRAGGVVWYHLTVTGRDQLTRKSGYQSPMWKVVATPDSGAVTMQWWVSQRHHHVDQSLVSEPGVSILYARAGL